MSIQANDYNLVVFLIILGIGAGVLICWAVWHFRGSREIEHDPYSMDQHQATYCREVRIRNVQNIAAILGRGDRFNEARCSAYNHM